MRWRNEETIVVWANRIVGVPSFAASLAPRGTRRSSIQSSALKIEDGGILRSSNPKNEEKKETGFSKKRGFFEEGWGSSKKGWFFEEPLFFLRSSEPKIEDALSSMLSLFDSMLYHLLRIVIICHQSF